MKFIHTADLHIGRFLENRPRWDEQQAVLDEIVRLVAAEQADLALLAGDIYDAFIPPAAGEAMFFSFVEQLAALGCAVVAIAGNHDQPQRLAAAAALAAYRGVYLVGPPGETFAAQKPRAGAYLEEDGAALHLRLANGERAVVAALPYLSEARLQELFAADISDEQASRRDYNEVLAAQFQRLGAEFGADTANFVLAHLFVSGSTVSDSERPLAAQVGGSFGAARDVFPAGADYIALGHLHRAQQIRHAAPCYYAGAPLAHSFSESGQAKSVMLGELTIAPDGAKRLDLRAVPLQAGRPLAVWRAADYQQALDWCADPARRELWVSLQIELEQPLTTEQLDALHAAHPRLVAIVPLYRQLAAEQAEQAAAAEKSIVERFADFVQASEGTAADEALLRAFTALLAAEEGENV